jgi:hypothetical protein
MKLQTKLAGLGALTAALLASLPAGRRKPGRDASEAVAEEVVR